MVDVDGFGRLGGEGGFHEHGDGGSSGGFGAFFVNFDECLVVDVGDEEVVGARDGREIGVAAECGLHTARGEEFFEFGGGVDAEFRHAQFEAFAADFAHEFAPFGGIEACFEVGECLDGVLAIGEFWHDDDEVVGGAVEAESDDFDFADVDSLGHITEHDFTEEHLDSVLCIMSTLTGPSAVMKSALSVIEALKGSAQGALK